MVEVVVQNPEVVKVILTVVTRVRSISAAQRLLL